MANKTTIVRNQNQPILLDKQIAQFILDKIEELKELSILRFEDVDRDNETRLDYAQTIIDCDNIILHLKENLK